MQYDLYRDSQFIMRGTYFELVQYIHRMHCYSFDHAVKYEGYSTQPVIIANNSRRSYGF